MLSEYAFPTSVSILTANCFIVSFGSLRISLHKTLWCCSFLSESNLFENSSVNLLQFVLYLLVKLKTISELHQQVLFGLMLCVYVSNFDGVV